MRVIRRRSKVVSQADGPQVLSGPLAGALAPHGPMPRKRRKGKRESGEPKRPPSGRRPSVGDVINAYWQRTELILVVPAPERDNGVRFTRLPAEHSCFVRRQDLEDPNGPGGPTKFVRMLNSHSRVRKAEWEGDWLRISWQDRDALIQYVKLLQSDTTDTGKPKAPIPTFEGMVSPVLRHMVDNDVRPAVPRRVWVDIETDSRCSFRDAMEGEARILCWVTDDGAGTVHRGMLDVDTDADEARLLRELWAVLDHYDQVLAWNGDRFDFPIIKARSQARGLLRSAEREWRRWLWLDHLDLYRRMNTAAAESGDEKTSYALNAVAKALLGEGKNPFDASQTWQEWEAGGARRQVLLDYCAQDTALMPRIEEKTGYVMLLQTVCDTCGTFPDTRGSNPGIQVESFLARLARDRDHKFPTVLKPGARDPYDGAYVMHPEKNAGIHRDVHVADFAAQYPTIIRTWNISPETIVEGDPPPGMPVAHAPLTKCNFRTDIPGILPEAVKQLMELRAKWTKMKASLPPGTDEWRDADRRSAAYKITANSFYGVIGSPMSRHYDRRVAESITQNAKWEILETIKAADQRGMQVIYADTDSLFVLGAGRDEFDEFVQWCNAELYPRITQEQGCVENHISLAYEKQFDRLVFTTAKRYVGSYTHYKGTDADANSKPEIKGLEFKRGDSLQITRRFQEEMAYRLVGFKSTADPDDPVGFDTRVAEWLDRVLEEPFDLDDIVLSKRLNKPLDDYKVANPMVRIAREMKARGEDVGEGAKISYVVLDAAVSPQEVKSAHEWDPETDDLDRLALWDKLIWPATQRLLEAAFPGHSWGRYTGLIRARKLAEKAEVKRAKVAEKERKKATPKRKMPARRLKNVGEGV